MRKAAAFVMRLAVTLALCAASWWLWTMSFSVAAWLQLGELDLFVRILTIFVMLSLVEAVHERLKFHA